MKQLERAFLFLMIHCRWYQLWSKIYRFFSQRGYRDRYPFGLAKTQDPYGLAKDLIKLKYSPDTWRQLWDVCSCPEWVASNIDIVKSGLDQIKGPMDCDEFAVYSANVLKPEFKPVLMSIAYKHSGWKYSGHMICVLEEKGKFSHIGNWGYYNDFSSLDEIAVWVAKQQEAKLIGYAIMQKEMNVFQNIDVHFVKS